jgi:hypothetical protein
LPPDSRIGLSPDESVFIAGLVPLNSGIFLFLYENQRN